MNRSKIQLGAAPIAWTNDDLPELGKENSFEQCISEMALAGYTGSEIGTKYPNDVKVLKKHLDLRGLTICNAWFSALILEEGEEAAIEAFIKHRDFIYALGARVIGSSEQSNSIQGKRDVPIFDGKPVWTDEQWAKVIPVFNRMGDLAEEKGMKFGIHHHIGTEIETPEEVEKLMELANDNVYLVFDTGHFVFSQGNFEAGPKILEKYIDRTAHIHLKDIRMDVYNEAKNNKLSFLDAVYNGVFTVPGDGDFNFKPIFDIIENSNYEGWIVVEAEQDPAKANAFEYAKKAREYIRENLKI
jgi:inosose dehydratase